MEIVSDFVLQFFSFILGGWREGGWACQNSECIWNLTITSVSSYPHYLIEMRC